MPRRERGEAPTGTPPGAGGAPPGPAFLHKPEQIFTTPKKPAGKGPVLADLGRPNINKILLGGLPTMMDHWPAPPYDGHDVVEGGQLSSFFLFCGGAHLRRRILKGSVFA